MLIHLTKKNMEKVLGNDPNIKRSMTASIYDPLKLAENIVSASWFDGSKSGLICQVTDGLRTQHVRRFLNIYPVTHVEASNRRPQRIRGSPGEFDEQRQL